MTTTRRIERRLLAILLGALGAGLAFAPAASAEAQAPPGADHEVMDPDGIFRRGLERFDAGDYEGAITIWERLLGLLGEPRGWKILYNLGLAYQAVGDATAAIARFDAFARRVGDLEAPAAPGAPPAKPLGPELVERRDDAVARARAIRAAHGAVRILAARSAEVILVRVGSAAPRAAGFTVYLAPGSRAIEIGSGTVRARRITVEVVAGASLEIDPMKSIGPAPGAPAQDHPADTPGRSFPTAWFVTGVGLTAVSVVLPVALGIRAQSLRDDAEALGPGHTGYAAAAGEFEDARTAHYVSFALPGALAAATLAIPIVYLSLSSGDAPRTGARPSAGIPGSRREPSIRVLVSVNQEGSGLWARGQF